MPYHDHPGAEAVEHVDGMLPAVLRLKIAAVPYRAFVQVQSGGDGVGEYFFFAAIDDAFLESGIDLGE